MAENVPASNISLLEAPPPTGLGTGGPASLPPGQSPRRGPGTQVLRAAQVFYLGPCVWLPHRVTPHFEALLKGISNMLTFGCNSPRGLFSTRPKFWRLAAGRRAPVACRGGSAARRTLGGSPHQRQFIPPCYPSFESPFRGDFRNANVSLRSHDHAVFDVSEIFALWWPADGMCAARIP